MLLGTPPLHDAPILLLLGALGPEPLRLSPLHVSHMSVSNQGLRLGAVPTSHPQQLELLATGPAELYELRFPHTARLTKQLSRLLARSVLTYSAEDNYSRLRSQGCTGSVARRSSELLGHGGQLSCPDDCFPQKAGGTYQMAS